MIYFQIFTCNSLLNYNLIALIYYQPLADTQVVLIKIIDLNINYTFATSTSHLLTTIQNFQHFFFCFEDGC